MKPAAFLTLSLACSAALPVWIDTDPSIARGGKEVDDGFALVQAFRSPELTIRGVSIVFGNAPLSEALPIGRQYVREFGPAGLTVHKGAASAAELGVETAASTAIASALRKEPLTLLVIGPATNIATVLRLHPELAKRIKQIVAVAGRRPGQVFRASPTAGAFRDLNFELDPEAFRIILNARVLLVLAPWEISSKVWLQAHDLTALRTANPQLAPLLDASVDWLDFWKKNLHADGFNPFDSLAVGYAISPAGFQCDRVKLTIETHPDDTSPAKPPKPYLLRRDNGTGAEPLYCHTAPATFKVELLRRLSRRKE